MAAVKVREEPRVKLERSCPTEVPPIAGMPTDSVDYVASAFGGEFSG